MKKIIKLLETIATELEEKIDEKLSIKIGTCKSEYFNGDDEYITIEGNLFMTINNGNLFTIIDEKKNISDSFDIFDSNAIINI